MKKLLTLTQKREFNEIWIKCVSIVDTCAVLCVVYFFFMAVFVVMMFVFCMYILYTIATSMLQVFQVVFGILWIYITWNLIYCQYHHSYCMLTANVAAISPPSKNKMADTDKVKWCSSSLISIQYLHYCQREEKNLFHFSLSALPAKNI